jgi:hypothetical protein
MNIEKTEKIIQGWLEKENYIGGTRRFKGLPWPILRLLVNEGYIDGNDKQNNAPSINEIIEFIDQTQDKNINFYVSGYIVSPTRLDQRLSVDTVFAHGYFDSYNYEKVQNIRTFFKNADSKEESPRTLLFWYD